MSSTLLPGFEPRQILTAEDLNALGSRIRSLSNVTMQVYELSERRIRRLPSRHFAFQLAERSGLIWCRRGFLDIAGELVPVGEKEWNLVGRLEPCTIWLNIDIKDDGQFEGKVEAGELELESGESNLHRRLGYVRAEEAQDADGDTYTRYHTVQVLGGLIAPCAPRRQMGIVWPDDPVFAASDSGVNFMHAGAFRGDGHSVDGKSYLGTRIAFGFNNCIRPLMARPQDGGNRLGQEMAFSCHID